MKKILASIALPGTARVSSPAMADDMAEPMMHGWYGELRLGTGKYKPDNNIKTALSIGNGHEVRCVGTGHNLKDEYDNSS